MGLLVVLVVLAIVPLWPWRPACRCATVWQGDLRDVYVDQFAGWLRQENVYHWRFGDLILLRVLPWLDRTQIWSRADAIYNGECKLAASLSDDQTIDGVFYPAPETIKRLKVELEPRLGPDPRIKPDGTRIVGLDTRVARFCPLFRATILEPPPPTER
jgi:hypothetical protein